jgi:hypothetical protein
MHDMVLDHFLRLQSSRCTSVTRFLLSLKVPYCRPIRCMFFLYLINGPVNTLNAQDLAWLHKIWGNNDASSCSNFTRSTQKQGQLHTEELQLQLVYSLLSSDPP